MTIEQLSANIEAGRYDDSAVIVYEEECEGRYVYAVYETVPPPSHTRHLVDTVGGYRLRWGLS